MGAGRSGVGWNGNGGFGEPAWACVHEEGTLFDSSLVTDGNNDNDKKNCASN